jgi:predicted permease
MTENPVAVLGSALASAFLIVAAGYLSKRFGFISEDAQRGSGQLIARIILPALLCRAIVRQGHILQN